MFCSNIPEGGVQKFKSDLATANAKLKELNMKMVVGNKADNSVILGIHFQKFF